MTDRVEQGQPELLGVLLVALHLQHGEPARLPRTAGPGAQQRRLPAAGRSRDDRHLPRRRAIQGSDKITPVDQPGSCWSHRQRPALISTPDTSGAGHAVRAPSPSVPGQRARCQPRANLGSAALSCRAAAVPSPLAQSRCGESPGSGDGLSPGWRQAWARRESSHGRQGTCSEIPGRYRDITSLRRRQRPRPARLRAHPAVGAGPAIRDRACGLTRRHGRRRQPPPRPGSAGHRHRPAHGRARRDHRECGAAAHAAGAWLLRHRPGVGGERLRGHLRRPAPARRPRR